MITTLGEVCDKIGSGATPRGGKNAYKAEGMSLIRSQNVLDLKFTYSGLALIDDDQAEALSNVAVEEADVLLNITGDSVARVCMVDPEALPARVNQHVAILRARSGAIEPRYLLYYLFSEKSDLLQQSEIGATRRALTKGMLQAYAIDLPPLHTQRAIAEILGSLDDKIDLLRRQNKRLEGMAEALFREWFMEGVGEDWEEVQLRDFATHVKNSVKPQSFPEERFVHYSLPAFDAGQEPVTELGAEIRSGKYEVPAGTILISKLNPRFPRIWVMPEEIEERAVCSTEFQVAQPKDPKLKSFVTSFLNSSAARDALISAASGTSGSHQRVRPKVIFDLPVHFPEEARMYEFADLANPLYQKIEVNMTSMRGLATLRDVLLPKFMAGDILIR